MTKFGFPIRTFAVVFCVVISGMCLSNASVADVIVFGSGSNQFSMEFVKIGNANNLDDLTGNPNPAGSVAYEYHMGKFEVSEDMIKKFNASQALQITQDSRGDDMPATSVSWNEAARFVNWLNTSTGGFAAYNFTAAGVNQNITPWTAADTLDYDPNNPYRSLRTMFVLPSMDEWYKAAYYDPMANAGAGGYFDFPTGSDAAPTSVASGTAPGTAVFEPQTGPADVMFAGGLSPYGIMGLGGNAFEWEETAHSLNNMSGFDVRGLRGGYWLNPSSDLSSINRYGAVPFLEDPSIGFRVARLNLDLNVVPEPSSWMLTLMGISGFLLRRRMKKAR